MDDVLLFLKTLADPTRFKLLKLVLAEELCVCELQELLEVTQPAVSQHIAKLKATGLVRERRAGLWTYYQGDLVKVKAALASLGTLIDADLASIPAMSEVVERRRTLNRADMCCNEKGARRK